MKKFTLGFLTLAIMALTIYACSKEESVKKTSNDQLKLESPEGYVLANSVAELKGKIKKEVAESYGQDYDFTITSITYTQTPDLTYADIQYTTPQGNNRNFAFYWMTDSNSRQPALNVAPHCTGECFAGEDCATAYDIMLKIWLCECVGPGGNNCKMTVNLDGDNSTGSVSLTCTGECESGEHCEAAYNPRTKRLYCRCDGGGHSNCQPHYEEIPPTTDDNEDNGGGNEEEGG